MPHLNRTPDVLLVNVLDVVTLPGPIEKAADPDAVLAKGTMFMNTLFSSIPGNICITQLHEASPVPFQPAEPEAKVLATVFLPVPAPVSSEPSGKKLSPPRALRSQRICRPNPICLRLLPQFERRAASRAACTAGRSRPMRTPMMAITTKSSTSVKPRRLAIEESFMGTPFCCPTGRE